MGISEIGGRLLAHGTVNLQTRGEWLVQNRDPDEIGYSPKLLFKVWGAPWEIYQPPQGHPRTLKDREGWHEYVRVVTGELAFRSGESEYSRWYHYESGGVNFEPHEEGIWHLREKGPREVGLPHATGACLLCRKNSVPLPQDGYSRDCELQFASAALTRERVVQRLSWPDNPTAFKWQKTLIVVYQGFLTIYPGHGDTTLTAGGYAFFEAFHPRELKEGERLLLPLHYNPLGGLLASVLFY